MLDMREFFFNLRVSIAGIAGQLSDLVQDRLDSWFLIRSLAVACVERRLDALKISMM